MDTFFQICLLAIIISLAFNTYWNIFLDFERGRLAEKFNAIILYDYATICLSILTLIYGIQKKERISYIFITLSIVNIATLSLHGSRGTWIGIPVILIIIFIIYYKTHLNRLIAILFFSTLLTLISLIIPNSPILKRLNQFNQDTTNIQQNNFNTSTGQRLALWSFSIDEFKKSPITGVGMVQFQEDACELKDRKILPLCSHAHNIFLQELGTHGVLGITSLFLIFMTSILFFLKKQNFNKDSQLISTCGISLIVYSIFCGFTDYFFLSGPSTLFFFLTLISLMSFKITQNTKSN
ncbi:O-antigen ligase family protein [Acinetobacter sp. GSS19]|uniref:O-antigen ligase family protein n=1 Tax=Acinetobacter sp. GSS19 TaxID=3020716 RepID=UPI00236244FF|nr:O-antigen ligase family protein [Acinetobacter sp. GSS19]